MSRLYFLKSITSILFLAIASSCMACSCAMRPMSVEKILLYDLVFEGEVIAKELIENENSTSSFDLEYLKYRCKIDDLISGVYISDEIDILSSTQGSACGVNYSVGDKFYFFVSKRNEFYHTGLCARNQVVKGASGKFKRVICDFKKSKKERLWKNEKKELVAKGKVVNQQASGHWIFYNEDGTKASEGKYQEGKKQGPWKLYLDQVNSEYFIKENADKDLSQIKNRKNIFYRIMHYDQGERGAVENIY